MINFDYIAKKDVKNQSPIWQKKFVITRIKKKKNWRLWIRENKFVL